MEGTNSQRQDNDFILSEENGPILFNLIKYIIILNIKLLKPISLCLNMCMLYLGYGGSGCRGLKKFGNQSKITQ